MAGAPEMTARSLRAAVERGEVAPADAVVRLDDLAHHGATRTARLEACAVLGDLAGRAFDADWDTAERAAFALLELARLADAPADRRGVITAIGRGFRNAWLLPFVHRRLFDDDPGIVASAIGAAGGLGFPALESSVAAFLAADGAPALRLAAIAALGRMGAMTSLDRLVECIAGEPDEAAAALTALTEIRTPAGIARAIAVVEHDLEPEVVIAAVRYLAELGAAEVLPSLRRLARHHDAEHRVAASLASRAFKAERNHDTEDRFLIALSEPDRAVRAVLARRLRTRPIAAVLEHAHALLSEDPAGVVQVLGELRDPEVTRTLLGLADRTGLPPLVRARAVGAIEANLPWERDALAALAGASTNDEQIRAAAIMGLGAFGSPGELLDRVGACAGDASAQVRGALLWAIQLAVRPEHATGADAARVATLVGSLLDDVDPGVRRRAAYVAGNLELRALAPRLVALCANRQPSDLRLAAHVALAELADPSVGKALLEAVAAESDPRTLTAASRAVEAVAGDPSQATARAARLAGKAAALLAHADPRAREAGAHLAGLGRGAVSAAALAPLANDNVPAVRAAAITALGRMGAEGAAVLTAALDDADPALRERAARGLLLGGAPGAAASLIAFASGDADPGVRAAIAEAVIVPAIEAAPALAALDAAVARIGADDPAYEPLLRKRLELTLARDPAPSLDVDATIAAVFPSFAHMASLRGFETLIKSLRTAESLFQTTARMADADHSPAIVLWMKSLENYVHVWLASRMATLQREPVALFDYVERVSASVWPGYQRWLESRWRDPVDVGSARVELPVRSIPNSLRELLEHRRKRLDSPLSVTEWARLLVLFAVDHPSGVRNLFKIKATSAEDTVRLAHQLHTLAAVRNAVAHRAAPAADTAQAFRAGYYAAFERLVHVA